MKDDTVVLARIDDPAKPGDGLAAEVAAAAPRRWWNRSTVVLAVIALLTAGFLAGVQVQQRYGDSTATGAAAGPGGGARSFGAFPGGGASAAPGGGASAAPGGASAADSAATTGTVKLVDGTTLYVETADGTVVTVRTSGSTEVRLAEKATLSRLKAGDTVTVQGSSASDGTVTATGVTGEAK